MTITALMRDQDLAFISPAIFPKSLKTNDVSLCVSPTTKTGLVALAVSLGDVTVITAGRREHRPYEH